MRRLLIPLALLAATPAQSAPCGGDWLAFMEAMKAEARAAGASEEAIASFFRKHRYEEEVLAADRRQGIFQKTFLDFSQGLISKRRLTDGQAKAQEWAAVLDRARNDYGVSPGILLAFWAFETDYGAIQGKFNTRDALLTLAYDCRRPEIFQPQVIAAVLLTGKGDFDPQSTTGAWAGEVGMVQMLPKDILEKGVDGDGDGLVTLKTSVPDALLSAANLLRHHGWRANEPWLTEVTLPDTLDWAKTGLETELPAADWAALGVRPRAGDLPDLPASLLLPQGRKGPAFLVYPNYRVLFEWNKSFVYVTTAAYFATRLEGAAPYAAGTPDPGLSGEALIALQIRLAALGHDVGKADGILGAGTRSAVQKEQSRLGLPADGWPTQELLDAL